MHTHVMSTHLLIRTRGLVVRIGCRKYTVRVLLLTACRGELYIVILQLTCKCLCAGELALKLDLCLPLQSGDQLVLCRGVSRCYKIQINKLLIDAVM